MIYDIVTFDIFDTLVHRRLRAPVDLFEAVRQSALQTQMALLNHDIISSFTHDRIKAESDARTTLIEKTKGEGEVTFDEIYDQYQEITGCGPALRQMLQTMELDLEQTFLFASPAGLKVFNELKGSARKIAFISDMYLPSRWLSQMLEQKGFSGASLLPIFVSGEHRKSKHSGSLYHEVGRLLEVSLSHEWLHVGDNAHADIAKAKELSLSTKLADWAKVDNRRLTSTAPPREYLVQSILDSIELIQLSHFLPSDEYERIGYSVFGPLIFGYMLWVLSKVKESKLNHLVFVARDGWLPHQLFEDLKYKANLDSVSSSYLHFSRRAGYQIGLRDWDVDQAWAPFSGKVSKSIDDCLESIGYDLKAMMPLLERFGFARGTIVDKTKRAAAHALLTTTFQQGLSIACNQRGKFKKYFEHHFSSGKKIGLIDIGWNGNIQRYLLSAMAPELSKERVVGLYIGLHSSATPNRDRGLNMSGWLSDYGANKFVEQYLQSGGVELLEFALTADHGTTLGYSEDADGKVTPILENLLPEEAAYREKAMKVQAGIRKFVKDHNFILGQFSPEVISSTAWAAPFERLVTDPTDDYMRLLAGLSHSDSAGATSSRLVLAARQDKKIRKSKWRLAAAREDAFWKAAFDRLNS